MSQFRRIYAGIGSRRTPLDICQQMTDAARQLASRGWQLRSGGADGADTAFEKGCDQAFGDKEIFLPWFGFNGNRSRLHKPTKEAFSLAADILGDRWHFMKQAAQKLHARNIHQVLGEDLQSPAELVLCWTPNGAIIGGTATALKLADSLRIRVINLAREPLDLESL